MASLSAPSILRLFLPLVLLHSFFSYASSYHHQTGMGSEQIGRRALKSFKETPHGQNVTFDCSPSGACVPCAYSEKTDIQYRCSETGYRIPLKCVKTGASSKEPTTHKSQKGRSALDSTHTEVKTNGALHDAQELSTSVKHRSLLDDSSKSGSSSQSYITYRSCIPPVDEEKLSVLGFEGIIMVMLILSGSAIYFRRKRTSVAQGVAPVRIPTSSRF